MASEDPVREALSAPAYASAYDKAMTGRADELTDEERAAIAAAREATSTTSPGYPLPWALDPTRRQQ